MPTQVTVISTISLSDAQRKTLTSGLEKKFGPIQLVEQIDEKLIGGIKVTVGSQLFDASLAGKLIQLKKNLK
jgi:F-type H+-transporting ATPase subunit delta